MDFLTAVKHVFIFYIQGHIYIAIALAIILMLLLLRKPKIFFLILFISLLLIGVLYLISVLSTTGISHKQKLIQQEEKVFNEKD